MNDPEAKMLWETQHGFSERHDAGRQRRHGKLSYRTWWAAAVVATRVNLEKQENERVEPYECRWGDHWAHGQHAPKHWHVGRPKKEAKGGA